MPDHGHDTLTDVPVQQLVHAADYFRHLPEPALAFNRMGKLTACNQAAADLHGCHPEDAAGSHLSQFFPPEAAADLARAAEATRSAGAWRGELPILAAGYVVRTADVRMVAVGEAVAVMYTDVTGRDESARITREVIRWEAVRDTALAAVESLPAPLPEWAEQTRRFAVGSAAAVASVIDQGAGRTVLLSGFEPMVRTVIQAFLERCNYHVVSAEHPSAAAELLRRNRERVRAAVLGPDSTTNTLNALRRVRPLLPAVTLGWERSNGTPLPYPVEPGELIRNVAEAVAADHWNDTLSEEAVIDLPTFINS